MQAANGIMTAIGRLAEWFKAAVLKTADLKGSVSSNLTPSAIYIASMRLSRHFVFLPMFLPRIIF
jgi:hypothetical protein